MSDKTFTPHWEDELMFPVSRIHALILNRLGLKMVDDARWLVDFASRAKRKRVGGIWMCNVKETRWDTQADIGKRLGKKRDEVKKVEYRLAKLGLLKAQIVPGGKHTRYRVVSLTQRVIDAALEEMTIMDQGVVVPVEDHGGTAEAPPNLSLVEYEADGGTCEAPPLPEAGTPEAPPQEKGGTQEAPACADVVQLFPVGGTCEAPPQIEGGTAEAQRWVSGSTTEATMAHQKISEPEVDTSLEALLRLQVQQRQRIAEQKALRQKGGTWEGHKLDLSKLDNLRNLLKKKKEDEVGARARVYDPASGAETTAASAPLSEEEARKEKDRRTNWVPGYEPDHMRIENRPASEFLPQGVGQHTPDGKNRSESKLRVQRVRQDVEPFLFKREDHYCIDLKFLNAQYAKIASELEPHHYAKYMAILKRYHTDGSVYDKTVSTRRKTWQEFFDDMLVYAKR